MFCSVVQWRCSYVVVGNAPPVRFQARQKGGRGQFGDEFATPRVPGRESAPEAQCLHSGGKRDSGRAAASSDTGALPAVHMASDTRAVPALLARAASTAAGVLPREGQPQRSGVHAGEGEDRWVTCRGNCTRFFVSRLAKYRIVFSRRWRASGSAHQADQEVSEYMVAGEHLRTRAEESRGEPQRGQQPAAREHR